MLAQKVPPAISEEQQSALKDEVHLVFYLDGITEISRGLVINLEKKTFWTACMSDMGGSASSNGPLKPEQLTRFLEILEKLPPSAKDLPEKDKLYITYYKKGKRLQLTYNRLKPAKEVFDLYQSVGASYIMEDEMNRSSHK